jgi:hypothetical protein
VAMPGMNSPSASDILPPEMPRRPTRRTSITLIGARNLAHALGPALRGAGYTIDAVAARQTA